MKFQCNICKEDLDDVYSTKCGHIFHFKCINSHFAENKNCPTCQEPSSEVFQIFLATKDNDDAAIEKDLVNFLDLRFGVLRSELTKMQDKVNEKIDEKFAEMSTDFKSSNPNEVSTIRSSRSLTSFSKTSSLSDFES